MKRRYLSVIILLVLLLGAGAYVPVGSSRNLAPAATPFRPLADPHWNAQGVENEIVNVNPTIASCWGEIAFVSDRDGDLEIYTMSVDGSNLIKLTNNSTNDEGPSWSPDSKKIVFHSFRDGYKQIYVMNCDGSGETHLLSSEYRDQWVSWSPDGTEIAFARGADHNSDGWYRTEVFVMNSDGTNVRRLTFSSGHTGEYAHMAWPSGWSPDSSQILFYWYLDGYDQLYIMNRDGTSQRKLTTDTYWNAIPSMSPDGTRIAFSSLRDDDYEVYVVNADGTNQTRLTYAPGEDWRPVWSPNGSKILFESERGGRWQLYSMNPDGGEQTRLSDNTANDRQGAWRPAGGGPTPFLRRPFKPAEQPPRCRRSKPLWKCLNAFFDHKFPNLRENRVFRPFWGEPITGNISRDTCEPRDHCYDGHNGSDFGLKWDTQVLAAYQGTARYKKTDCGGHTIIIRHPNGYQTRYLHLRWKGLIVNDPEKAVKVSTGQRIGRVGKSGTCVTGKHLHFAVYYDLDGDGRFRYPKEQVDPFGWMGSNRDPWEGKGGPPSYCLWVEGCSSPR